MFDLKVINSVLDQLEEERGIPRTKMLEAIESALATAYKKEYGKKGQIIRATFDINSGATEFFQVKVVVDPSSVIMDEDEEIKEGDERIRFNPEHHILLEEAKRIKKDVKLDDEITFPLEGKDDFGRIAAQTAKQIIIQKIREAEKTSVLEDFEIRDAANLIAHGNIRELVHVQLADRGLTSILFADFGERRGDGQARPAPLGPKIDQNRQPGLQNFSFKILLI